MDGQKNGKKFINYAHRGASEYTPENTFLAFYTGIFMGANGIETDVQMTKDGILVLFHDDTITRLTGKEGAIADYTLEELREFTFEQNGYQDKIVAFEEFLQNFAFRDLTFAIDYFHRMGVYFTAASASNTYAEQAFVDIVLPAMKKAGYDDELVDKTFRDVIILDSLVKLRDIEKMSFFLSRRNVDQISADLQGRFYVTDYSMGDAVVDTYFGEMNLAGVDKGSGIRHVLEATGCCVEDTIAIGDSRNDTEMLSFVGTAVAMGNATAPIKAMAHLVTTPIDQDGIYNAFLTLGLI